LERYERRESDRTAHLIAAILVAVMIHPCGADDSEGRKQEASPLMACSKHSQTLEEPRYPLLSNGPLVNGLAQECPERMRAFCRT